MPARSTRITRCSRAPSACGDALRRVELGRMPLPVVHRQRVALETLRARDRQRGRGIEPAGEQHDGARFGHAASYFPGTLPQRYLWS